ncbi:hypothetical protein B0T26DRAFT_643769 [Lasiosphaeria miniovina]|uniref:Uncharacterized protein n=1 Tax=Lasiosphaeria miniovina TaxID=1954250 RepID=A0AA40DZB4_9PEZI|nr:uncharacterized protein B0T26DRAFT_643769 [Lasiosphaeria miniovina]KAK0722104.1 hypothetical protein B0T26DRAFT_643769 [Lasiosphaeria miniovina]
MAATPNTGQIAQPVFIEGRRITVLYGSETGNGEDIAIELSQMAERLHFQVAVDDMDSFKLSDLLQSSLAIFVTSTTGQGDMPKNTAKFWRNLRREKLSGTNCLGALKFAIFGLGDSSYPKFNWAARKLRVRLLQLGASEFVRAGEGDERHENGIDSAYLPWHQELKSALFAGYPLPDGVEPIPDDAQPPPKYTLELAPTMADPADHSVSVDTASQALLTEDERVFLASRTKSAVLTHTDLPRSTAEQLAKDRDRLLTSFPAVIAREDDLWEQQTSRRADCLDKDNIITDYPEKYRLLSPKPVFQQSPYEDLLSIPNSSIGTLVANRRVTPVGHWQDVRLLTFDVQCDKELFAECSAGCTLIVYPKNFPKDVQELITMMGWEQVADHIIDLNTNQRKSSYPKHLYFDGACATLRKLLLNNLDITSIPKRAFIKYLVHLTREPNEIERLKELTALGNEQEFYDYTSRPRRTIIELLCDFPGVKIPYDRVLDLFPVIRGREFSICNGGKSLYDAGDYQTRIQLLVALVEYKTIIRKPRQGLCSRYIKHLATGSHLSLSLKQPSGNLLGTDQQRCKRPLIAIATGTGIAPIRALVHDRMLYGNPGPTVLFFGCRNEAADYYFWQEWKQIPNMEVYPAFSRDKNMIFEKEVGPPVWPVPDAMDAVLGLGPDLDAGKNYVQHHIRRNAKRVGELMRQKPIVCICGNSGRMPASVRKALLDALVISGVVRDEAEANKWFDDRENLTFWQETW